MNVGLRGERDCGGGSVSSRVSKVRKDRVRGPLAWKPSGQSRMKVFWSTRLWRAASVHEQGNEIAIDSTGIRNAPARPAWVDALERSRWGSPGRNESFRRLV